MLVDECLELEDYIQFITAHDICKQDGEVPKKVMSRETSGISQFCFEMKLPFSKKMHLS